MASNHLALGMLIAAMAACAQPVDVEPGSAAQEGRPTLSDVLALFADVQDVTDFTRPSATAWEEVETFTLVETDGGRFRDSTELHYNPVFPGLGAYDFTCRRAEPFLVCRIIRVDNSVSFYVLERRKPNEELSLQCERLAAPAPGGSAGPPASGTPNAAAVQALFADVQDVRDFMNWNCVDCVGPLVLRRESTTIHRFFTQ